MNCKHCNREIEFTFSNNADLKDRQECFNCNIWSRRLEEMQENPHEVLVIKGNTYWNGGDGTSSLGEKGFGGDRFYIIRNDGSRLTTDNLWHTGEVPELWRDRFPDNAVFVPRGAYYDNR